MQGKIKRLFGMGPKAKKGAGGLTPLLPAIRVEPKTYFANERCVCCSASLLLSASHAGARSSTLLTWLDLGVWFAFGALAIFILVWSVAATVVIALVVRTVLGTIRTSAEVETIGLDLAEHGEEGYHGP